MELMMEQQTQLKCEVYDLQKKLEATQKKLELIARQESVSIRDLLKHQTKLNCEIADLLKVIKRYQETWVDGALVEAEKKAVQDYIAELRAEITELKGREDSDLEEDEGYDEFDYEGVEYIKKDDIIYNTDMEKVGVWDGHTIDWTDEDAEKIHKEDRDDTDEEEEVPAWRKIENAFYLGRVDGGRAHASLGRRGKIPPSSLENAKERCLKLNLAGFTYNRQTKWIFFHKTIDPSKIVKTSWHKNNSGVYQKYTKWQWCDMYINCE